MSPEIQTNRTNDEQPPTGFYVFLGVIIIALFLFIGYLLRLYT
jgi:hypothetical protein